MASSIGLRPKKSVHRAVLLNETIEGLNLDNRSLVLDCTFGGGGHSREILKRYPKIKIIALDQDWNVFKNISDKRISFKNINFRNLDEALNGRKVNAIIFDLGLSSDQLESSGRGFSFMKNEPLLMTMKEPARRSLGAGGNPSEYLLTALDIVNDWSEKSLADIIYGYGQEKFSRKIARAIVQARKKQKIETTGDLVKIIENSVPAAHKRGRLHFATKTFQALRIAVNDELGALQTGLGKGFDVLRKRGRMSVISFQSLEDRIVKRFYKQKQKEGRAILINKKPITAKEEEIKNNPRSRSAKLRILEKI